MLRAVSLVIAMVSAPAIFGGSSQERDFARTEQVNKAIESASVNQASLPPGFVSLPVVLPADENAWTIQVLSRGGFNGAGRGNIAANSDGDFSWVGVDGSGCKSKLTLASIQPVVGLVRSINPSLAGRGPGPSLMCADCYINTLVVQRREAAGPEIYVFVWDDATEEQLPADARRLYDAVIAFKGCRIG